MRDEQLITGKRRAAPRRAPVWQGLALAALALAMAPVAAVTVHAWTDADGVRHFSDQPPPDDAHPADVFDIAVSAPLDAAEDYYSIANQWARLRAEREAADARALERQRARAEARAAAAPPQPVYEDSGRAVILPFGAGWPHGHRPRGHQHRPFPVDRKAYLDARRRSDFLPAEAPTWPRER